MMKIFISILFTSLLTFSICAQTIKLQQKKSDNDLKIVNGQYNIYLKRADITKAIVAIDSVNKSDNTSFIEEVKKGSYKTIDLNEDAAESSSFGKLLKSNLGSYLMLQGKVVVYKGSTLIKNIVADKSPEIVDLDGSSKITIVFSEEGVNDPVFLGDLNTKLQ
ncbi:hypothetical protein [Ferruginibacter albus]|uniref:hypothetical protein n=1 Tax=Ferruginibacter albus TaxID=2875540 RepID=UPI001CC52360|nr:hypothetical protein [Ferruginibacter albus]UAY51924.1 hypothetical protein K9M53_15200 [Ferruginibacter albus]